MSGKPWSDDVRGKLWTKSEEIWLRANYESVPNQEAARHLQRSEVAVRLKAFRMFGRGMTKRKVVREDQQRAAALAVASHSPPLAGFRVGPRDHEGLIYLMRARGTQSCKIGFTTCDVARRLSAMNSHSPIPVDLVATRRGLLSEEGRYHDRLREYRSHGEWFHLADGLLSEIVEEFQTIDAVSRGTTLGCARAVSRETVAAANQTQPVEPC